MPRKNVLTMSIPEPKFLCEGVEFGSVATSEIHFRLHDEGYRDPEDLYYEELYERESETISTGFFCEGCIEAFGKKTTNKTTLKRAIRQQMEDRLQKAADETAQLIRC